MKILIVLLGLFFAFVRLAFHRQVAHGLTWPGTFEAFAHIFVGFLLASAIFHKESRKLAWITLIVLSFGVEAVMFFVDNPRYLP